MWFSTVCVLKPGSEPGNKQYNHTEYKLVLTTTKLNLYGITCPILLFTNLISEEKTKGRRTKVLLHPHPFIVLILFYLPTCKSTELS